MATFGGCARGTVPITPTRAQLAGTSDAFVVHRSQGLDFSTSGLCDAQEVFGGMLLFSSGGLLPVALVAVPFMLMTARTSGRGLVTRNAVTDPVVSVKGSLVRELPSLFGIPDVRPVEALPDNVSANAVIVELRTTEWALHECASNGSGHGSYTMEATARRRNDPAPLWQARCAVTRSHAGVKELIGADGSALRDFFRDLASDCAGQLTTHLKSAE